MTAHPESTSPELHPALLPFVWLLGTWRGEGVGGYPTIDEFRFTQEITFAHGGKPVLSYTSRSWLEDGRTSAAESGYWRPQPDGSIEVVLAHASGIVEIYLGTVHGTRIDLATDVVVRTGSAKEVTSGTRLYGLVEGELMYAYDMAAVKHPLQVHLSARLRRS